MVVHYSDHGGGEYGGDCVAMLVVSMVAIVGGIMVYYGDDGGSEYGGDCASECGVYSTVNILLELSFV